MISFQRVSGRFSRNCFASTIRLQRQCRDLTEHFSIKISGGEIAERIRQESEAEMQKLSSFYREKPYAPILWQSQEEASSFVRKNIDAILFDCDGVLYRSPDPIFGAKECIENMMDAGKKVLFVTNNAGINRRQLKDKLAKILSTDYLMEGQMIPASYSAAKYLQKAQAKKEIAGNRVHVIGSQGLCEELKGFGFDVTGGPSEESAEMDREELADYSFSEHPIDAVVVGHDVAFTFRKLAIANVLLQKNPDAILIATNRDSFDLVGAEGRHIPGNGCVVAALEHCSRRTAINVGKPSTELASLIQEEHSLDLSKAMFVGDRLDTDIKFGADTGMVSALVMTGVTTTDIMVRLQDGNNEEPLPTAILAHVGQIL